LIGHEITALCGITHGETLSIVMCGTLRTLKEQKKDKLIQYANRIWDITDENEDNKIEKAIANTENFFKSIGLATRLSEKNIGDDIINKIQTKFNKAGVKFGERANVTGDVVKQILLNCK
jgi:NADP-dependent alcohol dehydrogenase